MKIFKILNNNVAVVLDEKGQEKIVMGKGICFKKKTGEDIDQETIDKTFFLSASEAHNKFQVLIQDVPIEHIAIGEEIISEAKIHLGRKLNDMIYISLIDHVHTSILRFLDRVEVKNVLLWDNKDEFQVGLWALDRIEEKCKIWLPEDEAGLHFYKEIFEECRKYQIQPLVTISHFDCPIYLIQRYGGWKSRKMIDFYLQLCEVLFNYYRDYVTYWLTFNEINMILHAPFMGAGIYFQDGENEEQIKYQAAHHELLASALATRMAHKINPENKVGCMFAAGSVYPYSCKSEDVWEALLTDQENYFFADVQARGYYPAYAVKRLKKKGVFPIMELEDKEILRKYPVDFVSFSYYNSRCIAVSEEEEAEGNLFN